LGGRRRTGRASDRDGDRPGKIIRKRLALAAAYDDRKLSGSCTVTVTSRRLPRIAWRERRWAELGIALPRRWATSPAHDRQGVLSSDGVCCRSVDRPPASGSLQPGTLDGHTSLCCPLDGAAHKGPDLGRLSHQDTVLLDQPVRGVLVIGHRRA
jgi:hypothetical protein